MEIVVLLVVVAVLALFVLVPVIFIVGIRMENKQKKAEANADQILDETFDGRDDIAVHVHMQGLKYETYVLGAKQRGYKVAADGTTNGYGSLVFEKITTPAA